MCRLDYSGGGKDDEWINAIDSFTVYFAHLFIFQFPQQCSVSEFVFAFGRNLHQLRPSADCVLVEASTADFEFGRWLDVKDFSCASSHNGPVISMTTVLETYPVNWGADLGMLFDWSITMQRVSGQSRGGHCLALNVSGMELQNPDQSLLDHSHRDRDTASARNSSQFRCRYEYNFLTKRVKSARWTIFTHNINHG
jgi:hypothetical protein